MCSFLLCRKLLALIKRLPKKVKESKSPQRYNPLKHHTQRLQKNQQQQRKKNSHKIFGTEPTIGLLYLVLFPDVFKQIWSETFDGVYLTVVQAAEIYLAW